MSKTIAFTLREVYGNALVYPACPAALRATIEADAAVIQARKGQQYLVSSSGQTVTLGRGVA